MAPVRGLCVVAALATAGSVGTAHADVRIAVAGPITGQYAAFGEQMRRGAELAVRDINAKGGVNGQPLSLAIADDACDPKQAVAVANQLTTQGVVFVDGHYCSGSSIPASQIYSEAGVLEISPASNSSKLTEQGLKNVFRTCGRDDVQGVFTAGYIVDNQHATAGRDRPRPDDVRQGPRRRGQAATQQARRAGGAVRGDQPGRQGLLRPDHQDEEC